jgi:hypothetical protein
MTMTTTPQHALIFDLDSVVARNPRLSTAEIEGETILYDEDSDALHVLDPVATVVWNLLDGQTSLRDACTDLADAFDTDRVRIEADVLILVSELAERGMLTPPASATATGAGEGRPQAGTEAIGSVDSPSDQPRFKAVAQTACLESFNRSAAWLDTATYRLGGFDIGVRSDRPEVAALLPAALAAVHQPEIEGAPPNFTLAVDTANRDGGVHRLYESCTLIDRERAAGRIVARLLRRLDAISWQDRNDIVAIAGCVLTDGDGRAVIGPCNHRGQLVVRQSQLAEAGLTLLDEFVTIDSSRAHVVTPEIELDIDVSTLADWGVDVEELLNPRAYDLRGWFVHDDQPDQPLTAGRAAAFAMRQVHNADALGASRVTSMITDLFTRLERDAASNDWRQFVDLAQAALAHS